MGENQAPVSQAFLLQTLKSVFEEQGKRYRKFLPVLARPAVPGEIVVTINSSGVETDNAACEGDFVVQNLTKAREKYIVRNADFPRLYVLVAEEKDGWSRYRRRGEAIAVVVEIGEEVVRLLGCNNPSEFEIEARWGLQNLRLADFFVTPLGKDEIYGIARAEFFETYERIVDEQSL